MSELLMRPKIIEVKTELSKLMEALTGDRDRSKRVRTSAAVAMTSTRTSKPSRSMEGENLNDMGASI